jgi:hypothetical protein
MPRKPYFDNPELEAKGKEVYALGFNIYQMISKLRKDMKLTVEFPDEVIMQTCNEFLRCKENKEIRTDYAWFVRVFQHNSGQYFANQHQVEGEKYKKEGVAQPIKDIMKGMFQ